MSLTLAGRALSSQLSDAFGLIETATHNLLDQSKARSVRVTVTPSFAANWLMPRIGALWDAHPDIEIEIEIELLPSRAPIARPFIESGAFVLLCEEENSDLSYHVLTRPEVISPNRGIFVKWLRSEAKIR